MEVAKNQVGVSLVGIYGDLERFDREFETCEHLNMDYNDHIEPHSGEGAEVATLADRLNRAAADFRVAYPDQVTLADAMAASAVFVAKQSDVLTDMERRHSAFGYGWGGVLDNTINQVYAALQVVLH